MDTVFGLTFHVSSMFSNCTCNYCQFWALFSVISSYRSGGRLTKAYGSRGVIGVAKSVDIVL